MYIEESFENAEFDFDNQNQSHWKFGDWDDPIEADGTMSVYLITERLSRPLPTGQYYVINTDNDTIDEIDHDHVTFSENHIIIPIKDGYTH